MLSRFFGRADAGAAKDPAPEPFSFPEPLPSWPQGDGFARGKARVVGGELELAAATAFDKICTLSPSARLQRCDGATFYRPLGVPEGFTLLGHYCQPNSHRLHGHLIVARVADPPRSAEATLRVPRDHELVWTFHATGGANAGSCAGYGRSDAYFWLPVPPEGYRALGVLVTTGPGKPSLDEVGCVRADLTDECEPHSSLLHPRTGTGYSSTTPSEQGLACLKNVDLDLSAMPTLEQVHAVIRHYGSTLYFHPKEVYLPSSVAWYFKNGAALFRKGGAALPQRCDPRTRRTYESAPAICIPAGYASVEVPPRDDAHVLSPPALHRHTLVPEQLDRFLFHGVCS